MEKQWGPEQVDKGVDALAMADCQGKMNDRDTVLSSMMALQQAAYMTKKDAKFCATHWATVKKLKGKVKPRDDDDNMIVHLDTNLYGMVPACFARAGDCKKAWSAYQELAVTVNPSYKDMAKDQTEQILRNAFDSTVQKCKGK